ncbi:MAG: glycosyltransferase [Gammaproteobacteria bacterium]|nr:glycosyltransferase [Gammaproteobacteria bacterium]
MAPHIALLSADYDITLVTSGSVDDLRGLLGRNVSFVSLQIDRKISLKNDLVALLKLWVLFREQKFDVVHSIMPKAGLLAMLAARAAGIPLRFHTFTGQVWVTKKGIGKYVLKLFDKIIAKNASWVLADSHSQRLILQENRIVKESKIVVLADGSFAGVNLNRFIFSAEVRDRVRLKHSIPVDGVVFLFLGRLNKDKGLLDLSRAFSTAARDARNLHLLIVGPDEERLDAEFSTLASRFPGRVHRVGFTDRPEDFLSAADVLCLPSYREGFPNVPLQAAAVGLPVIASRIYGITDAVEDGFTGILHCPRAQDEIAEAMLLLASNKDLRQQMGSAGRVRVLNKFSEERVTRAFADFYRDMF